MKITSWNSQGYRMDLLSVLISNDDPDIICLQECGNIRPALRNTNLIAGFPNSCTGIYHNRNHFYDVVFWYNTYANSVRNSLAILSRMTVQTSGIHTPVVVPPPYQPNSPRCLPWMQINQAGSLISIFSYHAPSSGTAYACNYTNPQLAHIDGFVIGAWAVVGDFNADPTHAGTFIPPTNGAVVRGDHITQYGGGLLDYSVTNAGPAYIYSTLQEYRLTGSDHYPQSFIY